MQVGTLVKYDNFFGIVLGYWEHPISNEIHTLVHWLTGRHTGDTDAVIEDCLEVLCK